MLPLDIWAAHQQSDAIKAQGEFQAQMQELNAQMAIIDAAEVSRQGISKQVKYQTQADKALAEQESFFASTGMDTNTGAIADVKGESQLNAFLNNLDIENQAFVESSKFKKEAQSRLAQADTSRFGATMQARTALISGYASAIANTEKQVASAMAGGA